MRAVRLEEMLPLAMEEERRAAVLRIRAARRGMRVKDERRMETKDRLLKQRPERREPMREVMGEVMTMERPRAQSPRKERQRMARLLVKRLLVKRLLKQRPERREQQEERRDRVRNRRPHRQRWR